MKLVSTFRYALSLALGISSLSLVACGSDGGSADPDGSSDDDGSSSTEGSGSGGPGGGGDELCGIAGATVVAARQQYGNGSVIRRLVLDGDTLFYGTVDEIWSVPLAGGDSAKVYPPAPQVDIYPMFWIRGADLVVGQSDSLDVLPKTGGAIAATKELPLPYSGTLDGRAFILLDGDGKTFFAKQDGSAIGSEEPPITYYRYDIDAGTSATVLEATGIGDGQEIWKMGDWIYTAHRVGDPLDPSDERPDEIHRIPVAGGAAQLLPLEGDFHLAIVGADDTHLFFAGRPVPLDITVDAGGYYRLPLAGGAPEKIIDGYVPAAGMFTELVAQPDRSLFWELGTIHEIPRGSGQATPLVNTGCEIQAFAAAGDDVYLSIFDDSDETAFVLRVGVP